MHLAASHQIWLYPVNRRRYRDRRTRYSPVDSNTPRLRFFLTLPDA